MKDFVQKEQIFLLLNNGETQEFTFFTLTEEGNSNSWRHKITYSATTELWGIKLFLMFRPVYNKEKLSLNAFHKAEQERLYEYLKEVFSKAHEKQVLQEARKVNFRPPNGGSFQIEVFMDNPTY